MDNRILELCKSVVDSSLNELKLYGVKCGMYNVDCHECPFWCGNRDDNMECYENKNKTQEIAKKYIEDNENNKKESDNMDGKRMKMIDIFNNWNNFKVGTEFYYENIEDAVFSKDRYNNVVFKNDIYDFSLDSELIVKEPEPVEYVDFDDIKIGEEFKIEDRNGLLLDNAYVKVEVFNEVKVLEKGYNGDIDIFVVNTDLSKSYGFKFIRK